MFEYINIGDIKNNLNSVIELKSKESDQVIILKDVNSALLEHINDGNKTIDDIKNNLNKLIESASAEG